MQSVSTDERGVMNKLLRTADLDVSDASEGRAMARGSRALSCMRTVQEGYCGGDSIDLMRPESNADRKLQDGHVPIATEDQSLTGWREGVSAVNRNIVSERVERVWEIACMRTAIVSGDDNSPRHRGDTKQGRGG